MGVELSQNLSGWIVKMARGPAGLYTSHRRSHLLGHGLPAHGDPDLEWRPSEFLDHPPVRRVITPVLFSHRLVGFEIALKVCVDRER